jgi:hypothetical protein
VNAVTNLVVPYGQGVSSSAILCEIRRLEIVLRLGIIIVYCSFLLHCIELTLRFAFMPSVSNFGYYSLVVFLC